jgi:hypothetical protein
VTGQYSKLETPEAQLEYLLLFVCGSRSASSRVRATLPNPVQMPVRRSSSTSHPKLRVPSGWPRLLNRR